MAAPGWYPNPYGDKLSESYWDGARWTATRPATQRGIAPTSRTVGPGWHPDQSVRAANRSWTRNAEMSAPPADGTQVIDANVGRRSHPTSRPHTTPAQATPGWYPDPSGSGGQRYWDGVQWTATRPAPPIGQVSGTNLKPWLIAIFVVLAVIAILMLSTRPWESDAYKQCVAEQKQEARAAGVSVDSKLEDAIRDYCDKNT